MAGKRKGIATEFSVAEDRYVIWVCKFFIQAIIVESRTFFMDNPSFSIESLKTLQYERFGKVTW